MTNNTDVAGCPACGALPCDQVETPHWRSIATVPEGTMVLLCSMMPNIEARHWAFVDWVVGNRKQLHPTWIATHWMPLPPPPSNLEGE